MLNERHLRSATVMLALLAGAGCAAYKNTASDAITVAEQHPISVDSQTVTLTLSPSAGGQLSQVDHARIRAFAAAYQDKGHGPIALTSPVGVDDRAVDAFAAKVEKSLYEAGLPAGSTQRSGYARSAGAQDSYILSYTHYIATPSACGVWEGIRERDYKNLRSPNFGCATQNNLAAMIVDPRELYVPADMTEPDSAIRIRGVRAFRAGEDTSSEKSADIEAQVSQ
ncbi:MAG: hypothetical protein GC152_02630 [Alphaproteobacteria bacterium]|nr:hypothetical protein [Alphaproteobacteria bacterium]